MAWIRMPQIFSETFITFFIMLLTGHPANATLIKTSKTQVSYEYVGCFDAWQMQFTKLIFQWYDPRNSISSCAEKCLEKSFKTQIVFLRGIECKCAPDSVLNATIAADGDCDYPCPGERRKQLYMCGGNTAYSVSCVSPFSNSDQCRNLISLQRYPITNYPKRGPPPAYPFPAPHITCGLCQSDLCAPEKVSPHFDYFSLNSAKECTRFCNKNISYVEWDADFENAVLVERPSTLYAILVWWKVPGLSEDVAVPICMCGDEIIKNTFLPPSPSHCNGVRCPGEYHDSCGGVGFDYVYGSVYCIEDGTGRCYGGLSPPTTTDTTPTTAESTGERDPVATETSGPSTIGVSTTEYLITTGETMAATPDTSPQDHFKPEPGPSTSRPSTKGTSQGTTTAIGTVTTKPPSPSGKKCSRKDRYGILWETGVNEKAFKYCSELIHHSTGKAYWKCNPWGKFETRQPDVSECRSKWAKEMEEKFDNIEDVGDASDYASSLSAGCGDHSRPSKYFGQEMFELLGSAIKTLRNVKTFPVTPTDDQFTDLVSDTVDLSACFINSPGPWTDLRMENKSHLYTHIIETTDDALFQLTHYVKSKPNLRKQFVPMKHFAAVAEAFEKDPSKPHKFPPQCDPYGKSCIKLPHDWTDIFQEKRVHVAIITMAPQSVATAMTGTGVYEVNGQKDRILNGRIMSLSVTSSSAESTSLHFQEKGVVINFRHIADAHGEEPYEIRRKLHEGELPKAVLGGSQCVFWDTKKNMWSGKGCHLVKTGRIETTCECSHLTAFSILMKVHSYTGKQRSLEILTLILCPLSELGLLLTIVFLSRAKSYLCKVRSTICKHLSFCLFLGNGMILTVLDRNNFRLSLGACIGAAIAGHYIILCAFMWMLLEGIQLYRAVVHVFESGKSYAKHFGVVAYGTPLIIVGITALTGYVNKEQPYGGDPYCWLIGNYIWLFIAPVAVVITINLVILFIALKTAYQLQEQHHQGSHQRDKKLCPIFIMEKFRCYQVIFKGCFSLTVILGLTWIVGFFTLVEGPCGDVAAYLFTILNASQGLFIFFFTCRNYLRNLGTLSSCFPSFLSQNSVPNQMPPVAIKKPFVVSNKQIILGSSNKLQS